MSATDLAEVVRDSFAATRQFFLLMQGYQNSPAFESLDATFPVAWGAIGLTVGATLLASLLATVGPARRAARIRPAVALRIAD